MYTLLPAEILTSATTHRFLGEDDVLLPPYAINPVRFTRFLATLPKENALPHWLAVTTTGGLAVTAAVPAHTILLVRRVPAAPTTPPADTDVRVRQMTTFYCSTVPYHVCLEGAPVVARLPLDNIWARIAYAVVPNTAKVEVMDSAWQVYVAVATLAALPAGTPLTMTQ